MNFVNKNDSLFTKRENIIRNLKKIKKIVRYTWKNKM